MSFYSWHEFRQKAAAHPQRIVLAEGEDPRVVKVSTLSLGEAKWAELQKIQWTDQQGASRVWEAANRKTRSSTGVDAIAVAPILLHPRRPAQTLVIKQKVDLV